MGHRPQAFSIIRLHNRDDCCWGVVDGRGALLNFNGLSMRLTKLEAQIIADDRNERAGADEAGAVYQASYSALDLQRIESVLAACRDRIVRQQATIARLQSSGHDTGAAGNLLKVFSDIADTHEALRARIVDYFHTLPDARGDPSFRLVQQSRSL